MNTLDWLSRILVIIGGINWGLIGLFSWDLVASIFGRNTTMSNIIYTLVGLAALYELIRLFTADRVRTERER